MHNEMVMLHPVLCIITAQCFTIVHADICYLPVLCNYHAYLLRTLLWIPAWSRLAYSLMFQAFNTDACVAITCKLMVCRQLLVTISIP